MLQFFRDKLQGKIVWLIVGLVIIVFFLGGLGYLFNRNYNDTLAKVDGETISLSIVNQQYQNIVKQHYAKKNYNKIDLDPKKLKHRIFEQLLNHLAVIKGLERNKFNVAPEQLLGIVKMNPKFQVNSKFSRQKYLYWLNTLGIKELDYQRFLRQQLLIDQLSNVFLYSNFFSTDDLDNFLSSWYQKRKVGYLVIPREKFSKYEITAEALEEYYSKNKNNLVSPEKIKIQYIEVVGKKLLENVNPTQAQLYKYYNEHLDYYTLPELAQVRHILIEFNNANEEQNNSINQTEAIAKSKAEDLLLKLKAGSDFKELAKKFSEDKSSALKGGDLGWIGKGEIDVDFESAAFNLKKIGDISAVVKSKFGYHILQLINKRDQKITKFEDIIDQVKQHYKEELLQPKLQDLYEKLAEISVQNTDLVKAAETLNLPVNSSDYFSSKGGLSGIATYSELVATAFNTKKMNFNSDVIRLADDHFVVFRVVEREPSNPKTFVEAKDEIKMILEDQAITKKLQEYADSLALRLAKAKNKTTIAKIENLTWKEANLSRDDKTTMSEILERAFQLSQAGTQKIFKLANGDLLILQLMQIQNAKVADLVAKLPDLKTKMQEQLVQLQAYLEQKLYEQELYNSSKIKMIQNIDNL